jgi:hypothetical protein
MTVKAVGGQVLYLYGVVASGQGLPRSGRARLEAVAFSAVAAIVEQVPARDFGTEALERRLQDIVWVAPLARKHAGVLEDVMQYGAVIPVPLCTLFSSSDALKNSLVANEQRFRALLSSLEGRQEWGLRISCDTQVLLGAIRSADPDLRALERPLPAGSPGQAYILRKQRHRRLGQLASKRIDEVVDEVLDALDSVTVDTSLRPLPRHGAFESAETMVLNAAFLVDVAASGDLHTRSAQLASRFNLEGFAFRLTGPWPPYSFCGGAGAASRVGSGDPSERAE